MDYREYKCIDSHVHMYHAADIDFFINYRLDHKFDAVNIACLCNLNKGMEADPTQNIIAAILKLRDNHFYAHGGLCYPAFPVDSESDLAEQIDMLYDIGFDGIKMLEAKPTSQKLIGIDVDNPIYDGVYENIAKHDMPVVSHVADPETFWDKDKAPEFSFKEGWFYGDGTFATKERLYECTLNVLEKHPTIRFTFPHFFFLSDYPERARGILDTYQNVWFDFTPGREMYDNFAHHYDDFATLIFDYSDRFMFGTDNNTAFEQGSKKGLIGSVKRFLCTEDIWRNDEWGFGMHGIALPKDKATAILSTNFLSRVGHAPKPINKNALARYIERYGSGIKTESDKKYIFDFAEKEL